MPGRPQLRNLRQALRDGDVLASPVICTVSPLIAELFGHHGFDWLFLDTEHEPVATDGQVMGELIRACHAVGVAATVRVRVNEPSLIASVLDAGAQGVWVPKVESAEQARRVVEAARFPPQGRRGAAPMVRSAGYGAEDWDAYVERVNAETAIFLVVETRKGIEHAAEIAAVEGVDAVVFGQFDYGVDAGLRQSDFYGGGDLTFVHPTLAEAAGHVLAACQAAGVAAGTVAWSREMGVDWVEQGYRVFVYGTDVTMFGRAARALREDIRALEDTVAGRRAAG